MSFLNPVNEPVLRFSSTDADAPQINYNARTAGDVKVVLKACLVTGYGDKASAGWSIVNEVDHVAEFVSPSAAMSDYRLGIDDSSTSTTNYRYYYQDVLKNPSYSSATKSFANADKTHASNGWQMLVTDRGLMFIELIQYTTVNKLSARITYWGAVKSAIPSVNGKNICFFNIGHNGATQPYRFYDSGAYVHTQLEGNTAAYMSAATSNALAAQSYALDTSNVDLVSQIYLASAARDILIGEFPPMLSKVVNATADMYGISELTLDGRDVMSVCAGYAQSTLSSANSLARTFLVKTDYWEY